jgi:asparagine synthase (glutamine-hydrolysing)
LDKAALVARRFKTDHHEFIVQPDMLETAQMLVRRFGEPFADSSAIPTFYVARETAGLVKTALSGDGGDELFGGYERYAAMQWASRLGRWGLAGILGSRTALRLCGGSVEPKSLASAARRFLGTLSLSDEDRYLAYMSIFDAAARGRLLKSELREQLVQEDLRDRFAQLMVGPGGRVLLTRASWTDLFTYLPGDILTKVDICAMANSLEVRCPFMDHRVVEAALALPGAAKCRMFRGKNILRRAFGDLLPADVLRGRKMGFAVPLGAWLRGALRGRAAQLVDGPETRLGELMDRQEVKRLLEEHNAGRAEHGQRIWALMMLELWLRNR